MKRAYLVILMLLVTVIARAQYHLDTLNYAGDSKYYIDIVFLGDGFKEDELDSFVEFVTMQNNQFFDKVPWRNYKAMFNIFYIKTASNESGAGMTPDEPIDNIFGVCFGTSGVDRMPWPTKWDKVYEVLRAVKPDYDMVPIVVNSQKYGGGGGGKFICFSMEKSSIETLRHESGHSLGSLADEYWYQGREAANMTQQIDPVKWNRWLDINGVGTYRHSNNEEEEGYSWYRPHQNCLMRYLNREYCYVCREALIEKIHANSKNVLSYLPSDKVVSINDDDMFFSLDLLKPDPNTLRVDWFMDDKTVAHNQDSFLIKKGDVDAGTHQLMAIVEDTTLMVRKSGHTTLHSTSIKWDVTVEASTGIETLSVSSNDYRVGPLPFDASLDFSNKQPQQQETRMVLLDIMGKNVASATFKDDSLCSLPTAHLPQGVYILCVYQKGKLIYKRKVSK